MDEYTRCQELGHHWSHDHDSVWVCIECGESEDHAEDDDE